MSTEPEQLDRVRRTLDKFAAAGPVRHEGERRWRRYWSVDKGQGGGNQP